MRRTPQSDETRRVHEPRARIDDRPRPIDPHPERPHLRDEDNARRLSTTHSHTSTDANDVRCEESCHISQSLAQIVRDFLPLFLAQFFGRLAIDTPNAITRD